MKLTRSEKISLIIEGFITAGIVILIYFATYTIMTWLASYALANIDSEAFNEVLLQIRDVQYWGLTPFLVIFLAIAMIIFIYWRLKRRQRQYELSHIIDELHLIAEGDFEHRISKKGYSSDMQHVIDSIHTLVDSAVEAMEEERRIEQTKDELITNVSHDIRTPLTSIIGYIGLIDAKRFTTQDELDKYVSIAYSKAKQMKVLVDDLFEYIKVRHPSTQLNIMRFDMVQLIEQLAIDFELQLKDQQMNLSVEPSRPSVIMEGDSEQIVRLMNNLMTNALKYGAKGQDIKIEILSDNQMVTVRVMNTGSELPDDPINVIFDRFYRMEESRSPDIEGTGLGLAISKSIVDLHNGQITAKSEGDWTVFEVNLPHTQQVVAD
ncbi:MAG TPA: HAMP domain-containing sensor histidine kinase [Alloiococcus sp.]|nr:HAMP domain-containing sensor histidine kinase [Alloiococcus sp.]